VLKIVKQIKSEVKKAKKKKKKFHSHDGMAEDDEITLSSAVDGASLDELQSID
jgi:hypothetical protein